MTDNNGRQEGESLRERINPAYVWAVVMLIVMFTVVIQVLVV